MFNLNFLDSISNFFAHLQSAWENEIKTFCYLMTLWTSAMVKACESSTNWYLCAKQVWKNLIEKCVYNVQRYNFCLTRYMDRYPWRRNMTTSMVGLKNGHMRKYLTQNGEPQRPSWGGQKKKYGRMAGQRLASQSATWTQRITLIYMLKKGKPA